MIKVIGHRGAAGERIENTLDAFRAAAAAGADGVELDVRRCASGELVIVHDATLERLAGVPLRVAETTWDELAAASLRVPHLPEMTGRLCRLDDLTDDPVIVHALKEGFLLSIEIKAREAAEPVARWVSAHAPIGQVIIYSFHPEDLVAAQKVIPSVRTNLLCARVDDGNFATAARIGAWSVNIEARDAAPESVARARAQGLQVSIGVSNTPEELQRAFALDAWAVHSDLPALAVAERTHICQGAHHVGETH